MGLLEGKSWSQYVQVPGSDGSLGHVVLYFREYYDTAGNYSVIETTGGKVNHSAHSGRFALNLSVKTTDGIVILESKDGFGGTVATAGTAADIVGSFPITSAQIPHNSNGTCSITTEMKVISMTNVDDGWAVWDTVGSQTVTLTTILQPSKIAGMSGVIGSRVTLSITKSDSTFTHTLRYALGDAAGTITEKTAASTVSWVPDMELCAQIPDAAADYCTVYCDTYNGSGLIGTTQASIRLGVPPSVLPVLNEGWATVFPYNDGTTAAGMDVYAQGISKVEASFDADKIDLTAAYGASIKWFGLSVDDTTITAAPYRSGVLHQAGDVTVQCVAADSRGNTVSETFKITVQQYAALVLSNPTVFRCDADGNEDEKGTYASVCSGVSSSDVSGKNTVTLRCRMKPNGGEYGDYTDMTPNTPCIIGGGELSTESTYIVEISATDTLGNSVVYTGYVSTAAVFFHGRDGGKGAAFGKYAEEDDVLDVGWLVRCTGLEVLGDVSVNGQSLSEYILAIVNGTTTAEEGSDT